jgi:hypothetical protein
MRVAAVVSLGAWTGVAQPARERVKRTKKHKNGANLLEMIVFILDSPLQMNRLEF